MKFWNRKFKEPNWEKFFGVQEQSKKQKLIRFAQRKSISIFVDDNNEVSEGRHSDIFRSVASEAEIEKRISDYKKLFWQKTSVLFAIICSIAGGTAWLGSKLQWF